MYFLGPSERRLLESIMSREVEYPRLDHSPAFWGLCSPTSWDSDIPGPLPYLADLDDPKTCLDWCALAEVTLYQKEDQLALAVSRLTRNAH